MPDQELNDPIYYQDDTYPDDEYYPEDDQDREYNDVNSENK